MMMKRTVFLTGMLAALLIFGLVLAGCEGPTGGSGSGNSGDDGTRTITPALRAEPVAVSSSAAPEVVRSYTDGTKNYYLIKAGKYTDIYISDIFPMEHYNGFLPMTLVKSTSTGTVVTDEIKKIISNSITTSSTVDHSAGLEAKWKKQFLKLGEISVKANYQWTWSRTNLEEEYRSLETSSSTVKSYAESYSREVTLGEHGEPAGYYRYALYAVCDVYFEISTNSNNSELLSWNTVVSAPKTLKPKWDYSEDGMFDNSPEDGSAITINFADDFYNKLAIPTSTIPIAVPVLPPVVKTSSTVHVYDGDSIKNTEAGQSHTFNRPVGLNIEALKNLGYTKINIAMDIEIRAKNTGNGRKIWLDIDGSPVWRVDNLNVTWTSWKTVKYTQIVSIASLKNESVFRFGFDTRNYDWSSGEWWFNTANVTFTVVK